MNNKSGYWKKLSEAYKKHELEELIRRVDELKKQYGSGNVAYQLSGGWFNEYYEIYIWTEDE